LIVVLDTNLVVSAAILMKSIASRCFDHAMTAQDTISSPLALDELLEVLKRTKFDKYVSVEDRLAVFADYSRLVRLVSSNTRISTCRDDDDNGLLEIAVDGQADVLVTGDLDLLVLNGQFLFVICTPRDYLERFTTA